MSTTTTYHCDRCRKEFPGATAVVLTEGGPYRLPPSSYQSDDYADLCDECVDSLKRWWSEPSTGAPP